MSRGPRSVVAARLWIDEGGDGGGFRLSGRWGPCRVLVIPNPALALRPHDAPFLLLLKQNDRESKSWEGVDGQ